MQHFERAEGVDVDSRRASLGGGQYGKVRITSEVWVDAAAAVQ